MHRYAAVAIIASALAGCSRTPSASIRVDPALATLIPSDTVMLAGVRVEPLRESAVYKKYANQIDAQLDDLAKRSGIDARKDLWELMVASNGKDGLLFARGKFSDMGLEPKLEAEGAKRSSHRGYTIIGTEETAVAFINPTTAVVGRPAMLRSMLDTKDQPKGGNVPVLLERAQRISSANEAWFAGIGGVRTIPVPPSSNLDNLNRMIQSVQSFHGGADLNSGVKLAVEATCSTPEDAQRINGAVKGIIGMGRLSTGEEQKGMLRLYDAIEVSSEQNTVRVNAELTEEMLDTVMRLVERGRGSTSSPGSPHQD